MSAAQFIRTALTAINKNPKLLECTPASLISALLQAAQLGLSPDGILGEAYLIPFYDSRFQKNIVQFIPGYRGLVQLAMRSGLIKTIQSREVYETHRKITRKKRRHRFF